MYLVDEKWCVENDGIIVGEDGKKFKQMIVNNTNSIKGTLSFHPSKHTFHSQSNRVIGQMTKSVTGQNLKESI